MKLVVITHTPHWKEGNTYYAYGPYIREMNLWLKHSNYVEVVAPRGKQEKSDIHWRYDRDDIQYTEVKGLSFVRFRESIISFLQLPLLFWGIFKAMRRADHIHLRCPGNIGMIGALVQILFPKKKKTVKYAGNWDPGSKQPLSYRFQKWLLSNAFLTRNMKVLVYGVWEPQTKNIIPFFTASYTEVQKAVVDKEISLPVQFVFVGSLVSGKRPDYAINSVKALYAEGYNVRLDVYGDGVLRTDLEKEQLPFVFFHGNKPSAVVQEAFKKAHFVLLPSKSEGWPKVIAEGMFYGAVPLVTPISCVPWMLNDERRGALLSLDIRKDTIKMKTIIDNPSIYKEMSVEAQEWSQDYTLERFEASIKQLLQ